MNLLAFDFQLKFYLPQDNPWVLKVAAMGEIRFHHFVKVIQNNSFDIAIWGSSQIVCYFWELN